MSPIEQAIAKLDGQSEAGRLFGVSTQAVHKWIQLGFAPVDRCPDIERMTGVRCEDLNNKINWSFIRGESPVATSTSTPPPTEPIDIYTRRRARLQLLVDQRTNGNVAAFADQINCSRASVSQFLSDTYNEGRSIGERAARTLEKAAGLPINWLDQLSDAPADTPPAESDPLALILAELRLQTEMQRELLDLMHQVTTTSRKNGYQPGRPLVMYGADTSGLPG